MSDKPRHDKATVLQLAHGVVLRLAGSDVEIEFGGQRRFSTIRALSVLERFASPTPIGEAIERLPVAGAEDFIHVTSLIARLREAGILVAPDGGAPVNVSGFDRPVEHVAMLDDQVRTKAFLGAIRAAVRPGDVVLEIGTGTGILAVEAARAGARHVYAVEQGRIATAAAEVLAANGVADRVDLLRGRSTTLELPERADVLVAEVIGNDPLGEDLLSTFRDAHRRLLKKGARLVPHAVHVVAQPVDLPDEYLAVNTFTETTVNRWGGVYALDLQPLVAYESRVEALPSVKPQDARRWRTLSEPVRLATIDLERPDTPPVAEASFVSVSSAENLGVLLCFEAELGAGLTLTTVPSATQVATSWRCPVFKATRRRRVRPGESVRLAFSGASGASTLTIE
jgi:precorrin-6B methylase 2